MYRSPPFQSLNRPQLRFVCVVEYLLNSETFLHFVEADHLVRRADFGVGEFWLFGDGGGEGSFARIVGTVQKHGYERSSVTASGLLH